MEDIKINKLQIQADFEIIEKDIQNIEDIIVDIYKMMLKLDENDWNKGTKGY